MCHMTYLAILNTYSVTNEIFTVKHINTHYYSDYQRTCLTLDNRVHIYVYVFL